MFGTNKVTSPFRPVDEAQPPGSLKVTEVFYTIQGEGPDAGKPAIFIRLTHCNLRCYFCDTKFDEGTWHTLEALSSKVLEMSQKHQCTLAVITGGEPCLQEFTPLVSVLNAHGVAVSVETAGLAYFPSLADFFSPTRSIAGNLIVCSPKTPKIHTALEQLVGAYKYIVKAGQTAHGLPIMSTQIEGQPAAIFMSHDVTVPVFIQPMDEQDKRRNHANLIEARDVCLRHGYRVSVQMHKLLGVD